MRKVRKLFLSPVGRIARLPFIIGVVALMVFYTVQHFTYPYLGHGLLSFFVPMVFFFLNLHIVFCLFGKRLHDMGRTTWPLFGMIFLALAAAIFVGLKFGMLEYFESVHALMNDPKLQTDSVAMAAAIKPIEETYQQRLQANMPMISTLLAVIPLAFTFWLALVPGQKGDNRYGPSPVTFS